MKKNVYKLIQDIATIKEAFIIDELQSYMDLKDPSNPKWAQLVRVRLQEKKDWEQRVKGAIENANYIEGFDVDQFKKEIGLEDKE